MSASNVLTSIGGGLYFICPIQGYGSIIIDIDVSAFLDMVKVNTVEPEAYVLITDNKGQTILQNNPPLDLPAFEILPANGEIVPINDASYYMYSQDIPSIGYRCTVLNSVNVVEINLRSVNAICILMLAAVTIFSILLFVFNRRTYLPVQKLIAAFGPENGEGDQLAYITKRFTELTEKERTMEGYPGGG